MNNIKPQDIAKLKPAMASSTSTWSHYADPQRDACGANASKLADDYGFHTLLELNPWWMVDLLEEFVVERIMIVNRQIESARFRTFTIDSSRDCSSWITRFIKITLDSVSSDPDDPWTLTVADPFVARYVRIRLLGNEPLHLRQVQIFGLHIQPP